MVPYSKWYSVAWELGRSFPRRRADVVVIWSGARSRTSGGSVMRPTLPCTLLPVNHMFPSGPAAMPQGLRIESRPVEYSVISPEVVIRPILPGTADSVNQRFPSGPAAISRGADSSESPSLNSVTSPLGVIRPMLPFEPPM